MNLKVKNLLIQAIESGKYEKTKQCLSRGYNCFCILGLLCELHRLETNGPDWKFIEELKVYSYMDRFGKIPNEVKEWAGINGENPLKDESYYESNEGIKALTLIELNDYTDLSFKDMLPIIKKEL